MHVCASVFLPLVSTEVLGTLVCSGSLRSLSLINVGLNNHHGDIIAEELSRNISIEELDLSNNQNIGEDGLRTICSMMEKQFCIKTFRIEFCCTAARDQNESTSCLSAAISTFAKLNAADRRHVLENENADRNEWIELFSVASDSLDASLSLLRLNPKMCDTQSGVCTNVQPHRAEATKSSSDSMHQSRPAQQGTPWSENQNNQDTRPKLHAQQLLLLLYHSQKCPHEVGCCTFTSRCAEMKRLWKHMIECRNRKWLVLRCDSSRAALSHQRECKSPACAVCKPVREHFRRNWSLREQRLPSGRSMGNSSVGTNSSLSRHNSSDTGDQQKLHPSHIQPSRLPKDRPIIKLSASLYDTYKKINAVYHAECEAQQVKSSEESDEAVRTENQGWDDKNFDYIFTHGEVINERYEIKERVGKGSFGQVVRAVDLETKQDVAIKIIKSKIPFLIQSQIEIDLLRLLQEKDPEDEQNIVRFLTHFVYRNHRCLVFEMLSLNLYELLRNTHFVGVSLNLVRSFAKQVLKSLAFFARDDVDIIHCDLKPENILLRHPKESGVKIVDFGSSCRSNKRMYSYIQSRYYRAPEVILGLPYSVAIDMWSLGCMLAEMNTGEPLFYCSDHFELMQNFVKLLGMLPKAMLDKASDSVNRQFFDKKKTAQGDQYVLRTTKPPHLKSKSNSSEQCKAESCEPIEPSTDPIGSLTEVITVDSLQKSTPSDQYNTPRNYELFIDLVSKMLTYKPEDRITPEDALSHPFIQLGEQQTEDPQTREG